MHVPNAMKHVVPISTYEIYQVKFISKGTLVEVSSLDKYDENKLIELFSPYGEIIQARVIRDQSTESPRGIAFVIMATRTQAQRAGENDASFYSVREIFVVECLNGQIIDHQRPLLVKFADDDKRRRQLMTRYLPQIDGNIATTTNLRDPSEILATQMAQLNLIANGNNLTDQQQQEQDMNFLMNTLLMMPFWSNMCAPNLSMPVLYPNTGTTTTSTPTATVPPPVYKPTDRMPDVLASTNGA